MLVYEIQSINNSILPKMDEIKNQTIRLFRAGETELMNVKTGITKSFQWQEKKMNLAQDLLLVEAETETLPLDESSSPLD